MLPYLEHCLFFFKATICGGKKFCEILLTDAKKLGVGPLWKKLRRIWLGHEKKECVYTKTLPEMNTHDREHESKDTQSSLVSHNADGTEREFGQQKVDES